VGGVAILTLIINGTTCGRLVNTLGLAAPSNGKKRVLAYVQDKIYVDTQTEYERLVKSGNFLQHQGNLVQRWCSVLRKEDSCGVTEDSSALETEEKVEQEANEVSSDARPFKYGRCPAPTSSPEQLEQDQLMHTTREVFLQATQAAYWELKENGEFPGGNASATAMHILLHAVDQAQDCTNEGLKDWEYVQEQMSLVQHGFFRKLGDTFGWLSEFFTKVSQDRREMNTYIVLNFIKAHQMAQVRVCFYFGRDQSADTPEEKQVIEESNRAIEAAQAFLKDTADGVMKLVSTKQVASRVLKVQMQSIRHAHHQGLLTAGEAQAMESVCLLDLQDLVDHTQSNPSIEEASSLLGGNTE